MFLNPKLNKQDDKVFEVKLIDFSIPFYQVLNQKLWNEKIWDLRNNALLNYKDGFKMAIIQRFKQIRVELIIGYKNSTAEIFQRHNPENILYKIANETAPFSPNIVCLYKDAGFFAFPDGNPQMTTHDLIISKKEKMHLGELNFQDWQQLYTVIENLLKNKKLDEFRLDINVKNAQVIPQFHMHVLSGLFVPGVTGVNKGNDGYPEY